MSELYLMPLQACKDSQQDPDFCVIARVEALIAGHGMEEALRRANAYREAGSVTYIYMPIATHFYFTTLSSNFN